MGKNDVVRHDLQTTLGAPIDWEAAIPLELPTRPGRRRGGRLLGDPPTDTMIHEDSFGEPPYQSVGKMKMAWNPANPRRGSGWVVAKRAYITAAHCVYKPEKGGWILKAFFCPRFNVDCVRWWPVSTVLTLQGFIDDQTNDRYDLAACIVAEEFTDSEPPLPFQFFTTNAAEYAALGYPGTPTTRHPFNAKRMWQSYGKFLSMNDGVVTAENDFTGGSSGGPWLDASSDMVVGLTSSRDDDPDTAHSPVFADGFRNLYNAVKDL